MKKAKERVIYSNYDLHDRYDETKQFLIEDGIINPTENDILESIYFQDSLNWNDIKSELDNFFTGNTWILQGVFGTWHGPVKCGFVFDDFSKMVSKATKDCDFVKLADTNGHFYIECSHHDGNCLYEIKKIEQRGLNLLARWDNGMVQKSEQEVHDLIMKSYSTLPNFVHKIYGVPKREYVQEENHE